LQLRSPFFQKLNLLLHALVELIEWDEIVVGLQEERINLPFKRVLLIFLKLIGEDIPIKYFNDLN
jgi:hypothetical protein